MISPVDQLLSAMETLLVTGNSTYNIPATFPTSSAIQVFRSDAPVTAALPLLALCQDGPCKERHLQGSGLWEIPVSARLVLDRNGTLGNTADQIEASIRSFSDDMEAVLTMPLRLDPNNEAAGFSTPEQRLTTASIQVWEISDVSVEADTELEGDPVCEVKFTAFCCHADKVI
jgi:hypothetical protein